MGLTSFVFRQFKYTRRYNQIIRVLFKYGFDDYVSGFATGKRFNVLRLFVSKRKIKEASNLSKWERMRMVCEELGPTFVKFGQVLSSRRDLLPEDLIYELTKLQDSVPPFSGKKAQKIIEEQFGDIAEGEIEIFEETPFASASMSQVHRATLKTGEKIIFKIQRPKIRETIEEDLQIIMELARFLTERLPSIRHYNPIDLVKQFQESIFFELDFIHESINLKRITYNFKDDAVLKFPKVYEEFTSSKILALEEVIGFKPSEKSKFETYGIDEKEAAKIIVKSFFTMVFEHGFFHADPHPGNIIITPDKHIYFIDFGMMGTLLKKDMEHLGNMVLAIQQQDVKILMNAISYLTNAVVFQNQKRLEYDLVEYINKYAFTTNFHTKVSEMLTDLTNIMIQHNLNIPGHFFLLTRAMFSLEGLVRVMNPEIVLMDEIKPIIEKRIIHDRNPITTGEKIINSMYDLGNYLEEFPSDLRQTMKLIRKGKLKVNMEHQGIDPFVSSLKIVGRQIVSAVLIAALILSATVFILAGSHPQILGIPVYSYISIIAATIIAIYQWLHIQQEKEKNDEY